MRCIDGFPSLPFQYAAAGSGLSLKAWIFPVEGRCGPRQKSMNSPIV